VNVTAAIRTVLEAEATCGGVGRALGSGAKPIAAVLGTQSCETVVGIGVKKGKRKSGTV
jgi:hypothetical protein